MAYRLVEIFRHLSRNMSEMTEKLLRGRFPPHSHNLAIAGTNVSQPQPLEFKNELFSWNGILWDGGVPKKKQSLNKQRRRKFNLYKFKPYVRSWHMYEVCEGCGNHYKKYHLCGTCYDQTRYETNMVREHLKQTGQKLSQESVLRYQNEDQQVQISDGNETSVKPRKEINISNRKRPSGWFKDSSWSR